MLQVKDPAWRHFIADFTEISAAILNDPRALVACLLESLRPWSEDCTWLCHHFDPHGVSVVAVANSMRAVVHTWPERERATIDVWTDDFDALSSLALCGKLLAGDGSRVP